MLLTSLIISLFCCGWRIVTDEGQLLYFLRKPFDKLRDKIERQKELQYHIWGTKDLILCIAKPIILCITCMASFWGAIIYYVLNHGLSVDTIICCVISAFLNNVLYFTYNKFLNT